MYEYGHAVVVDLHTREVGFALEVARHGVCARYDCSLFRVAEETVEGADGKVKSRALHVACLRVEVAVEEVDVYIARVRLH